MDIAGIVGRMTAEWQWRDQHNFDLVKTATNHRIIIIAISENIFSCPRHIPTTKKMQHDMPSTFPQNKQQLSCLKVCYAAF